MDFFISRKSKAGRTQVLSLSSKPHHLTQPAPIRCAASGMERVGMESLCSQRHGLGSGLLCMHAISGYQIENPPRS